MELHFRLRDPARRTTPAPGRGCTGPRRSDRATRRRGCGRARNRHRRAQSVTRVKNVGHDIEPSAMRQRRYIASARSQPRARHVGDSFSTTVASAMVMRTHARGGRVGRRADGARGRRRSRRLPAARRAPSRPHRHVRLLHAGEPAATRRTWRRRAFSASGRRRRDGGRVGPLHRVAASGRDESLLDHLARNRETITPDLPEVATCAPSQPCRPCRAGDRACGKSPGGAARDAARGGHAVSPTRGLRNIEAAEVMEVSDRGVESLLARGPADAARAVAARWPTHSWERNDDFVDHPRTTRNLLDAYGAQPERWPEAERAAAQA
jgi:hypothetical protein